MKVIIASIIVIMGHDDGREQGCNDDTDNDDVENKGR